MTELINTAVQTVPVGQAVVYNNTVYRSRCGAESYRGDGGQIRLNRPGVYRVSFNGNIAVPTGGTVEAISIAIAVNGEPVAATTMISTPAAVEEYNNVFGAIFLDVPRDCCS